MIITKEFLKEHTACSPGYQWFLECGETDHEFVINKLIDEDYTNWANWCIVRLMTPEQCVKYAIFSAELVIDNYEQKYPDDDRPRKAIEAVRNYLNNKTEENRENAWSAARSAENAARSAEGDAWCAARSAASAAWCAARSAENAERSAENAACAENAAFKTIITYGLSLLNEELNEAYNIKKTARVTN